MFITNDRKSDNKGRQLNDIEDQFGFIWAWRILPFLLAGIHHAPIEIDFGNYNVFQRKYLDWPVIVKI